MQQLLLKAKTDFKINPDNYQRNMMLGPTCSRPNRCNARLGDEHSLHSV